METDLHPNLPNLPESPLPEAVACPEPPEEPKARIQQESPLPATPQLPEPPQPSGPTPEEISQMVADAEQRGYLRARNEMAESFMSRPGLFENPLRRRDSPETARSLAENFLSELPRGVWD